MIENLAALEPVQGALDQIVQRFGTEMVAEVTGRSRQIVRKAGKDGLDRLAVENRPGGANLSETQAFMDDEKRILVFGRRRYGSELSRRALGEEPPPSCPLSPGSRLARRRGDPGSGSDQSDQSGAAAVVSTGLNRREGGEAVSVDNRAPTRHAGGDHQGPTPDRRPRALPRRRQSRNRFTPARRCASSTRTSSTARSKAARCSTSRMSPACR